MAMSASARKSVSIHDYPEHLNPFHEDDNHNRIRFWTLGKKLTRSNSITFSGLKDIRNSWALRSFMKKGKKGESSKTKATSPTTTTTTNGAEPSPIAFRRALQYSSSSALGGPVAAPRTQSRITERYEYGGSITPLPRSRFQERLKSVTPSETQALRGGLDLNLTPRMARSDITGSRLSVESTNPFDEEGPTPPVRASRRKKKRAPPPPLANSGGSSPVANTQVQNGTTPDPKEEQKRISDPELENTNINVELKIVEEDDTKDQKIVEETNTDENITLRKPSEERIQPAAEETDINKNEKETNNNELDIEFPKVNIVKYRRNSSINENDVQLRRDQNKEFTPLTTRSKSLTNTNNNYITYDINLNIDEKPNQNEERDSNESVHKIICKFDVMPRKQSVETVSSTEKEFMDIEKATKEMEHEINKLNSALNDDELVISSARLSVVEMKKRFDTPDLNMPNPIPKPKRSVGSPVNGSS